MDVFHILAPRHMGFEDEIIKQANQRPQNSQENHANEICRKGDDLLGPDDKSRSPGTSNDSRLPEFAKT